MTVLVLRRDDDFSQALRHAGIEVINLELIATEVFEDLGEFENLIRRLGEYDGVFFTSPVGVSVFVEKAKLSLRPTFYALGRRATSALVEAGFAVKTIPEANTAGDMLEAFGEGEFSGKKLLFVRGEQSVPTIPETLAGIADVDEVAVYRTVEIEVIDTVAKDVGERLTNGEIEYVCFFSPSAVDSFERRFGHDVKTAAIGETTAGRARELGFEIGLIASKATNEVFAAELTEWLKQMGDNCFRGH